MLSFIYSERKIADRLPAINIEAGKRRAIWRVKYSDLEEFERQSSTHSR